MDEKWVIKKLDEIGKDVAELAKNSAVQNAQLEEHIRRTHMLEQRQESFQNKVSNEFRRLDDEIEPAANALQQIKGVKVTIWFVGAILAICVAIAKLV